jgi:hypothetical protein
MTMANSKDGKFQKGDPETKEAAKKGGESSRSSGSQGSKSTSGSKTESKGSR